MVRFFDLEDPDQALAAQSHGSSFHRFSFEEDVTPPTNNGGSGSHEPIGPHEDANNNEHPAEGIGENVNSGSFSKILASYPCIRAIVNDLDQNDLLNLSMSCKQFRANLLENRRHLFSFTLRCKYSNLLTSGSTSKDRNILKVSNFNCVTDLVFRCLDCNEPVCRNCKAKVQDLASNRLGQMCTTCRSIPLSDIVDDPTSFLCRCKIIKGESWACKPCALNRKHQYTIRARTWDRTRELSDNPELTMEQCYEYQCSRGLDCCGNGWEQCSEQEGMEIKTHGLDFVPTVRHGQRGAMKYRALCLWCSGFVLPPAEEEMYWTLTA